MQIAPELKEILDEVFQLGRWHYKRHGHSETVEDYIELNEAKILALGKPRPLTKNKANGNKSRRCTCALKDSVQSWIQVSCECPTE